MSDEAARILARAIEKVADNLEWIAYAIFMGLFLHGCMGTHP